MAKHGASLHKAAIKPGTKIKIQIATRGLSIAQMIKEAAEKLSVAAPGLNDTDETTGNPCEYVGELLVSLKRMNITKAGKLNLSYEIGSKA